MSRLRCDNHTGPRESAPAAERSDSRL